MEISVDLNRVIEMLTNEIATLKRDLAMAHAALESVSQTADKNSSGPELPVD